MDNNYKSSLEGYLKQLENLVQENNNSIELLSKIN